MDEVVPQRVVGIEGDEVEPAQDRGLANIPMFSRSTIIFTASLTIAITLASRWAEFGTPTETARDLPMPFKLQEHGLCQQFVLWCRTMKNSTKAFVFYAVTLTLAVAVAFTVRWIGEASLAVTMLTPAIATVVMLALVSPEGGFRKALSLLGLDRAGFRGWPLAIAGPFAIHSFGLLILFLAGLSAFAAPQVTVSPVLLAIDIFLGFAISTLLALGEEVGWRGYMLPRLLIWGALPAMLMVGLLHGVWHLPILLTTDYYHSTGNPWLVVPLFLVTLTLAGVFFGFLRLWTGSVWAVAISHAAANTAWNVMNNITQTKSPLVLEYVGGESGLIMIGGLLVFGYFVLRYMRGGQYKAAVAPP
jgi:uncharacterized protein